jgi:ketosteroid isomerase-like protein
MNTSDELRDVIAAWFAAVATRDTSWVTRHVSRAPGARLVGTDPAEVLAGEAVARFLETEARNLHELVRVSAGEVEAYEEGSVGWGLAQPVITFADGSTARPRWSAVFHREDGAWRLVQLHASIAVGNEEVGFESQA